MPVCADGSCSTYDSCCSTVVVGPAVFATIDEDGNTVEIIPDGSTTITPTEDSSSTAIVIDPPVVISTDADGNSETVVLTASRSTTSGESTSTPSSPPSSSITTTQSQSGNENAVQSSTSILQLPTQAAINSNGSSTISKGALAGVVISTAILAVVLPLLVFMLVRHRRHRMWEIQDHSPSDLMRASNAVALIDSSKKQGVSFGTAIRGLSSNRIELLKANRGSGRETPWQTQASPTKPSSPKQSHHSTPAAQYLPMIHELPAYSENNPEADRQKADPSRQWEHPWDPEPSRQHSVHSHGIEERLAPVSTTEAEESGHVESTHFGRARIVRIGRMQ